MLNASQVSSASPSRKNAAADQSQDEAQMFDLDAEVEPVPETTQMSQLPGASPNDDNDIVDDFGAVDDDDDGVTSQGPTDDDRSLRDYHMGNGGRAANIFNKAMDDIK